MAQLSFYLIDSKASNFGDIFQLNLGKQLLQIIRDNVVSDVSFLI